MSKARSHKRTVIAMAALAVLASLALIGGAEAAGFGSIISKIIGPVLKAILPKGAPADAMSQVAKWLIGTLF